MKRILSILAVSTLLVSCTRNTNYDEDIIPSNTTKPIVEALLNNNSILLKDVKTNDFTEKTLNGVYQFVDNINYKNLRYVNRENFVINKNEFMTLKQLKQQDTSIWSGISAYKRFGDYAYLVTVTTIKSVNETNKHAIITLNDNTIVDFIYNDTSANITNWGGGTAKRVKDVYDIKY